MLFLTWVCWGRGTFSIPEPGKAAHTVLTLVHMYTWVSRCISKFGNGHKKTQWGIAGAQFKPHLFFGVFCQDVGFSTPKFIWRLCNLRWRDWQIGRQNLAKSNWACAIVSVVLICTALPLLWANLCARPWVKRKEQGIKKNPGIKKN